MNSPSTTSKRTAVMTRPAGPLKCNLAMAARFLHGLDPDADAFTFQTRDDRGYNLELSYALHSRLDTCARRLHVLNHYGAGVFVTVNKTNGQGRALQQIKRVRGVWQQRTGQGQPLPLKPHLGVASDPHQYESYWRVAGLTVAQARAIQETLVAYYGADQAAQDLTGVLRMPGFYHWQDEPHWVRLIQAAYIAPYPAAVLMNAVPIIAFPGQSRAHPKRDAMMPDQPLSPPR